MLYGYIIVNIEIFVKSMIKYNIYFVNFFEKNILTTSKNQRKEEQIMARVGNIIEKYQITDIIWQGSTSTIYLAKAVSSDAEYGQYIAIKALSSRKTSLSHKKQFKREAKILMKLSHPYILKIFKFVNNSEDFYHFMEYIEGKSLRRVMLEKSFSFEDVIKIFKNILYALEYMEKNKIIHKDIKPENILVSDDLKIIKLADFGFATKKSFFVLDLFPYAGTKQYMAPERKKNKIDYSSDIYSLAKTIEEVLTKVQDDIPDFIYYILSKCTKFSLKERYKSANAVLKDLQSFTE